MNSIKTTAMAVCSALVAVGTAGTAIFDGDPATVADFSTLSVSVLAAIAAVGFWFSRDNDVSDERAGARKF